MSKFVWVTGGAGYIGSHVCKCIAEHTDLVPVSIDNLLNGRRDLVKWGPLLEADIRDSAALADAVRDYEPCAVMHLAALTSVEESMSKAFEYWSTNVAGTLNLLECMRSRSCGTLIFSSSASVYGSVDGTSAIPETLPLNPVNLYGETKRVCEKMIESYARSYGLKYAMLRYFNVAGSDPDAKTGRCRERSAETLLIPRVVNAAADDGVVQIYGTDYATRDGTAMRDYIHVSDIADAHISAMRYLDGGGASDVFNIGTGSGMTVMEIVKACESVMGKTIKKTLCGRRAGDPERLTADPSKAQRVMGWTSSELSKPENIIRTALEWDKVWHEEHK